MVSMMDGNLGYPMHAGNKEFGQGIVRHFLRLKLLN